MVMSIAINRKFMGIYSNTNFLQYDLKGRGAYYRQRKIVVKDIEKARLEAMYVTVDKKVHRTLIRKHNFKDFSIILN